MATFNGIYKVLNSSGTYDQVNLRTTAEQVVESTSKRFVSDSEKSTWNSKANASHTHTSAHITDATSENTANTIVKRDSNGNFKAGTVTANLSGNASSATKLQTARTINGTSFDGSANITTSNWGTSRTLKIGNSGKSVNGSGNITWTLSEIGAAPTSHGNHVAYAICDTAASTAEKVVTVSDSNWALSVGQVVMIKFAISNTASSVKLNVNGTGAYPIWYNNAEYTGNGNAYTGYANRVTTYMFNGTHWVWIANSYDSNTTYSNASLGQGYATCDTAEATTDKVATLSSYSLTTGGVVSVKFKYAVPASSTLNVNSKGAKPIYYKGAAITANIIGAGDIATFIYNGSQYQLIAIDRWASDITTLQSDMTQAKSDIISHTHKYAGSSSAGGAANSAVKLASSRTIALSGDATGSASFDGSANATITTTLANSGVTAGSYGPTGNATASFSGTISVPQITVDAKGRVTSAVARTITLPSNPNSDTKVTNTLNTTTKAYVTGTTSSTTNTGTQVFDTGVYLDTVAGSLVATTFKGTLDGNATSANSATTATKATQDSSGQQINKTYIKDLSVSGKTITFTKGDGTTGTITTQDTNTDTKVTNTLNTTAKAYITGTTSSSTNTGTQVFDTGVYLDTTAGTLVATKFKGALEGNATSATTATTATTCTGNAASATKLQNARTINGVSFNGTANITIKADPNAHTHAHTDITGLGTAATLNTGTSSGQIPVLGSGGKLSTSVLPSVSINNTHTVETVNAALSLSCGVGDIVIITSYVQPANLEKSILSKETQRALNSGSNTFICINSSATSFDEKFKVLMSSSDAVTHAEFNTSLNNKVDKVSGKGLSTNDYTTTEKNKLAGIAANANNYVHPSNHDASMITQSASYRFVTDTEKSTWNNKANSSHSHDSTYLKLSGGSVTGNIIFNNNVGVQGKNTSGTAYTLAKVNASNQAYLGTESLPAVLASSANPKAKVGSNEYVIYHTGNKPTASDVGALTQSTADGRYRNKTDLVFTDTISIVTPAT